MTANGKWLMAAVGFIFYKMFGVALQMLRYQTRQLQLSFNF